MSRRSTRWGLPLLLVAIALLLVAPRWLARPWSPRYGSAIDGARPVATFTLTDQRGAAYRLGPPGEGYRLLFFGYSHCPDVCPLTLVEVADGVARLGAAAERVEVVMVTVDPERDRPEVLAPYLALFDPRFVGLTGTHAEIVAVATAYGIYSDRTHGPAPTDGDAPIDHTAVLILVDPAGAPRALFPHDIGGEALAADLSALLRR